MARERRRESLAFRRRSLVPLRVLAHLALLATRNGELALWILYSWHFSQYISNDIHAKNVSLVDDYFFLKTLILSKSLFLILKLNLLDMHNKGTGPSVYTILLSYDNSVIKESFYST